MKKIYFATGNKQKLARMQELVVKVADDFVIQKVPELIDVEENGITPVENAMQKVDPYQNLDAPIIAGDTGVYFDDIAFDPTHVKRQALNNANINYQTATQEEIYDAMIEFYKSLADSK
jgi:inosine/xanthosine triphosphate pyrophosphatase family protein